MRSSFRYSLTLLFFAGAACGQTDADPAHDAESPMPETTEHDTNPFFAPSSLHLEAPDFNAIRTEHYRPAFEAGMARQLEEIQAIASNPEAPTVENTLVAMERSGELLTRVQRVFFNMTSAHTNEEIQAIQAEVAPKLAAHSDDILLDRALFDRVRTLYDDRANLQLDPESERLLEESYRQFVRAGALLGEEEQARIREVLRPIYDDWLAEMEAQGIDGRAMLEVADYDLGS
jgi:peptidyl-dipeptidase Dcp